MAVHHPNADRPAWRGPRAADLVRGTCILALSVAAACPLVALAQSSPDWLPLKDRELAVEATPNALDFSALRAAGAAGARGWAMSLGDQGIGFAGAPAPQRFLAASMVFNPENGGLPDKPDAERLARQLARTGYNLARLHFIDAQLMQGRDRDFDFDPVQFDRLQYLMAQLKANGIYWLVDGMTSDNAGHGGVFPNRYVRRYNAKLDTLISDAGFDHWTTLVDRLWGTRNRYTGLAPLEDPALLGIILVNEGGIAFMATIDGGRYPDALRAPFNAWLRQRFASDEALKAAWGSSLAEGESLSAGVALPTQVRGSGPRDIDFARFVGETERSAFRRMDAHVRARGFGGLTMAFDNWGFLGEDLSRAAAATIDMHGYHATPTLHGRPGSRMVQTSLFDTFARGARELTNARQWGKPFTVSEYGQPFWNGSRREMPAIVAAMAAHQGWSAICQFAETPVQFDYGRSKLPRRDAIYPYGIGADPIARAEERLAALLFLRGDVRASPHRVRWHVDPDVLLARRAGWEQVPEALSRLAFIAPVGLDIGAPIRAPGAGEALFDLTSTNPGWWSRVANEALKNGLAWPNDVMEVLRRAGIVGPENRSRPEAGVFESDTGELSVDMSARRFLVDSARTKVVLTSGADASAGVFGVTGATGPALFAVSSLDGEALARSRHMLVWVLTDAENSDMRFADSDRTTLVDIGHFPPRVRTIAARLSWRNEHARQLRAWPLSLAGDRRAPIPVTGSGDAVELSLDTRALPDGPALMFELAAP